MGAFMRSAVVAKVKDEALVKTRRRQIVDAAVEVFLENSYHVATVGDVAKRVGISQGAMYTYVRSKDDILYMICSEAVDAHNDAVQQAISPHADPVARLRAAVHAFVVSVFSTRDATLVVYREAHDLEPRSIKALLGKAGAFIASFEDLLVQAKCCKTTNSRIMLANIVTYMPTVIANRAWYLRGRVAREHVIAETTAFLLRGLGLAKL
jgi:TetR/AcrR family transcriptional regulator, cholesterol catabolism regulator